MAVKIRLSRGGAKKRPYYRVVVADARAPRDGDFIEKVGTYNPMLASDNDTRITLNNERIKYWLANGAKPTYRVAKFLQNAGIELPQAVVRKMEVLKKSETTKLSKKELKEQSA